MDVNKILAALRQERAQIEEVIANLECLALSRERRRGRPPAILAAARKRGRPRGSKNKTFTARPNSHPVSVTTRPRAMAAGQTAVSEEPVSSSSVI
jgi:hypothetical protein